MTDASHFCPEKEMQAALLQVNQRLTKPLNFHYAHPEPGPYPAFYGRQNQQPDQLPGNAGKQYCRKEIQRRS